jgi:hypothetical protein
MIKNPFNSDVIDHLFIEARKQGPIRSIEISWIDLPGMAMIEFLWKDLDSEIV